MNLGLEPETIELLQAAGSSLALVLVFIILMHGVSRLVRRMED